MHALRTRRWFLGGAALSLGAGTLAVGGCTPLRGAEAERAARADDGATPTPDARSPDDAAPREAEAREAASAEPAPDEHARAPTDAHALLTRAIEVIGGRDALAAVAALRWTGTARVQTGESTLEIAVDTRVEPFRTARSVTWPVAAGRSAQRVMEVGPDAGSLVRGGQRTPMPPAMLRHEREQYALYGLLLLEPLLHAPARVTALGRNDEGYAGLRAVHPSAPVTDLWFTDDARLAAAANRVHAPDRGGFVQQRFSFSGVRTAGGITWPAQFSITADGKPYFELRLETFAVET